MISCNAQREHRFVFSKDDLKELLIDVLRFDGETIPDALDCDIEFVETDEYNKDIEVRLTFTNDTLVDYEEKLAEEKAEEKAEAEAETDAWNSDDAEEN